MSAYLHCDQCGKAAGVDSERPRPSDWFQVVGGWMGKKDLCSPDCLAVYAHRAVTLELEKQLAASDPE